MKPGSSQYRKIPLPLSREPDIMISASEIVLRLSQKDFSNNTDIIFMTYM